jgi:hypothetical protein
MTLSLQLWISDATTPNARLPVDPAKSAIFRFSASDLMARSMTLESILIGPLSRK